MVVSRAAKSWADSGYQESYADYVLNYKGYGMGFDPCRYEEMSPGERASTGDPPAFDDITLLVHRIDDDPDPAAWSLKSWRGGPGRKSDVVRSPKGNLGVRDQELLRELERTFQEDSSPLRPVQSRQRERRGGHQTNHPTNRLQAAAAAAVAYPPHPRQGATEGLSPERPDEEAYRPQPSRPPSRDTREEGHSRRVNLDLEAAEQGIRRHASLRPVPFETSEHGGGHQEEASYSPEVPGLLRPSRRVSRYLGGDPPFKVDVVGDGSYTKGVGGASSGQGAGSRSPVSPASAGGAAGGSPPLSPSLLKASQPRPRGGLRSQSFLDQSGQGGHHKEEANQIRLEEALIGPDPSPDPYEEEPSLQGTSLEGPGSKERAYSPQRVPKQFYLKSFQETHETGNPADSYLPRTKGGERRLGLGQAERGKRREPRAGGTRGERYTGDLRSVSPHQLHKVVSKRTLEEIRRALKTGLRGDAVANLQFSARPPPSF